MIMMMIMFMRQNDWQMETCTVSVSCLVMSWCATIDPDSRGTNFLNFHSVQLGMAMCQYLPIRIDSRIFPHRSESTASFWMMPASPILASCIMQSPISYKMPVNPSSLTSSSACWEPRLLSVLCSFDLRSAPFPEADRKCSRDPWTLVLGVEIEGLVFL